MIILGANINPLAVFLQVTWEKSNAELPEWNPAVLTVRKTVSPG
ncbi:hypothetical protein GCM10023188_19140 [Pontibacter saemangeumensis]|uniref:Uncharacterized protein n=1 Tax=Pontibacter saemangeumensis TaxID=1084525 RepID=A0ABP8LMD5_9BACT